VVVVFLLSLVIRGMMTTRLNWNWIKFYRFGHWMTLCTLNMHILTYIHTCVY